MEKNDLNKTPRRSFMKKMISGITLLGVSGIVAKANVISSVKNLAADGNLSDEEWMNQLQGKHKMLFDIPYHKGGGALVFARNFFDTNNETGTKDGDLNVVIVLRHGGSVLGLNDAMWQKYKLGELVSFNDLDTKKPAVRNEFFDPKNSDPWPGNSSILSLQKRGAVFCVCDKSMDAFASEFSEKMKMKKAEVLKDLMENMLPGTRLVPSGLWALGRLQGRGFPYCFGG